MALSRPPKFPEYARNDVVDPTSGVNNVIEPSESKKDLGHGPAGEFPPRQFLNWVHRITVDWLKYLDEQITDILTIEGTFGVEIDNTDFSVAAPFNIRYSKVKNIVSIFMPTITGTSISNRLEIKPKESANFPAVLLPDSGTQQIMVPFGQIQDSVGVKMGRIATPATSTSAFVIAFPDASGLISNAGFTTSGTKGFQRCSFTYSTDDS